MLDGLMTDIHAYLAAHEGVFQEDLCQWLRIPSVSTDSDHQADVGRAAEWLADHFRRLKFETQLVQTSGNPLVLACGNRVPGAPTALVYGHYDVQPPDPLDE